MPKRPLRRAVLLCTIGCLLAAGCAHRTPPERAAEDWYRAPDLFASFDPDAADLSLPNAYLLELACYIGDRGTFEVDRTLQTWGFTTRRDFRDLRTSTYGYVASNDRMVLVTFGGTDFMNVRDLLSDADALQLVHDERYAAAPATRVHRGFRDSLNSVIDGVIDEVRRQAAAPPTGAPTAGGGRTTRRPPRASLEATTRATTRPTTRPTTRATTRSAVRPADRDGRGAPAAAAGPKKLFVAGHSRGGAFAVLAAAALARAREIDDAVPEIGGVYTFGQPRVGNGPFVEAFASTGVPLFRFINRDDPIPDVPPAGMLPQAFGAARFGEAMGYRHGGVAVRLRADGRVVRVVDESAAMPNLNSAAGIGNHYQPGYHAAIYQALANPQLVEEPAWRATASGDRVDALPRPGK